MIGDMIDMIDMIDLIDMCFEYFAKNHMDEYGHVMDTLWTHCVLGRDEHKLQMATATFTLSILRQELSQRAESARRKHEAVLQAL